MSYFDDIYTRLFGKGKSPTQILVNEMIKRSQSFVRRFQAWKTSDYCAEFLNDLWQSYFWRKQGVDKDPQILLLESTYSNGFAINYEAKYGKNNFHYLFDYLADQVKKLDYRLVLSRHTMREKGDVVESKEMHYLKPRRGQVEPIDQKYGNVQIEYIEENDQPTRIKLIANSYPDRKYKQADNFEDLAQYIFSIKSKQ
ncbi:hypothetical protein SAMN05421640_3508 [Ekhidna lutea]|uniref:Uncharacterized protein n=1 Tax=Ekhidna lutea TaxID=447679 RepID=A0A239M1A0_EKHLU|nr:hypothetical protein [Ekhidna lutea]SNT35689.1 hypothetical protein SAMN05421640_3508 [Ekhidna lutea]